MTPPAPNLAEELTMAQPSIGVLLTLCLLFVLAVGMFWLLLIREQSNRKLLALREWARAARYRLTLRGPTPPLPLEALGGSPRMIFTLIGSRCTLARFRLPLAGEETAATPGAAPQPPRPWHVLIWPVQSDWPAAALRPANATRSLVDLLSLPAQITEGTQRFTVCSKNRAAARSLGKSSARGLLPFDIGLLLIGKHLLLDFSDRPFDDVEFNRMIVVAEQVSAQLPLL
jgi:hypothetical protein